MKFMDIIPCTVQMIHIVILRARENPARSLQCCTGDPVVARAASGISDAPLLVSFRLRSVSIGSADPLKGGASSAMTTIPFVFAALPEFFSYTNRPCFGVTE